MEQAGGDRLRIHPDSVRARLDARLNDRTIARLMASERLRDRLDAYLGTAAAPPDGFTWLVDDPAEAARRAGALLHGQAVRAVLSGPDVIALVAAIGRDAHALGLRHGALATPRDQAGDLAGSILRDGQLCLGAWLREQDEALRHAVRLALPPGSAVEADEVAPELAECAPAIMARVTASYAPSEAGGDHD